MKTDASDHSPSPRDADPERMYELDENGHGLEAQRWTISALRGGSRRRVEDKICAPTTPARERALLTLSRVARATPLPFRQPGPELSSAFSTTASRQTIPPLRQPALPLHTSDIHWILASH